MAWLYVDLPVSLALFPLRPGEAPRVWEASAEPAMVCGAEAGVPAESLSIPASKCLSSRASSPSHPCSQGWWGGAILVNSKRTERQLCPVRAVQRLLLSSSVTADQEPGPDSAPGTAADDEEGLALPHPEEDAGDLVGGPGEEGRNKAPLRAGSKASPVGVHHLQYPARGNEATAGQSPRPTRLVPAGPALCH